VAANDSYSTGHGQVLTVAAPGVLANDNTNGGGALSAALVAGPASGTVSLSAAGGFTFTPATGFSGTMTFTYRASNANGQSNVATVSVAVAAAAPAPVAANDSYNTAYGQALTVAAPGVLANDNTNGGGALSAALVAGPASGTVSLSASGGFTYTPPSGFSGAATFTYRASNTNGLSNSATVTVTVGSAPTAANDSYSTPFETLLTVAAPGVLANDAANGGGSLSASIVNTTTRGLLTLASNGSFSYTPGAAFSGVDTFTYRASNASGAGATATVSITVASTGEPLPPERVRVKRVWGNKVTFAWSMPKSGPAPTAFRIEGGRVPGEVLGSITVDAAPTVTVTWPSGSYYARVRTVSGEAVSAPSKEVRVNVNAPTAPSTPTTLVGLAEGDTLNLSWTNTYAGGEPSHVVLRVEGAINTTVPIGLTEAFTFSGVPPGTYTLSVVAANRDGTSEPSNTVTLTFPSGCTQAPAVVENVSAYAVGRTLFVNWEPPATGAAPSGYVLNVSGRFAGSIPTPTSLKAVSGVVAPGAYHFSVMATNACGASAASQVQTVVVK
jgi:Bacterial Ig domain